MKNFYRVIRLALRNRGTLVAVMLSSLAVGALWGANIGVVYPFVEIVFDNQSPQEWINGEVSTMEKQVSAWQGASETLAAHLSGANLPQPAIAERLSERLAADLKTETGRLAVYRWLQPYVEAYLPHTPFNALLLIVGMLLLGTLLKDFFIVINMNLVGRLAQLTMFDLRKQFFRQTLSLDLASLGASKNSTLISHFTYDLNCLTTGLTTLFGQALREPLKMIVCLTGACLISWRLLLLSLLVTPPALILMHRLARSMKRANHRAMEEMSQLYGNLTETFTGILTVKAFTMEQFERNRFHSSAKEFFRKAMRIVFYNSLTKPITELLGIGVISLALVAGGHLVLTPATHLFGIRLCDRPPSLADLLLFYGFLAGVSDPARKLSSVFAVLQAGFASADRIFPLIDREPAISDPVAPKKIQTPHRQLSVENVSFHYNRNEPVLHHVDLKINYGETIAIVGPNGCGKSTLINLLPRFYDPIEGQIKIDGVDVREVRRRDLRARIGMVTQKTHLFDDTVLNNIRYGSVGASDADIIAAAKKAHAHRFITTALANGYQTTVGQDGNLLSGGQRQRIALARAILRDPEILILDEATSQIDLESEELIHDALTEFARGRTAIIVTHRLSTIRLANRVVVMEAGEIKDVGRHEELLGRCPLYSRLHAIQFNQSA